MRLLKSTNWLALTLAVALGAACSRQPGPQAAIESSPQQLPFERTSDKDGTSPTRSLLPALVPAGTAIIIRLLSSLSSTQARPGDIFEAVLDEPIILEGETVAPRGAKVEGRVVDAKPSVLPSTPGYLRLTLTAISVNGKSLAVHTSSFFSKASSHDRRNPAMAGGTATSGFADDRGTLIGTAAASGGHMAGPVATSQEVTFAAERRLTFRLTQPLTLAS